MQNPGLSVRLSMVARISELILGFTGAMLLVVGGPVDDKVSVVTSRILRSAGLIL